MGFVNPIPSHSQGLGSRSFQFSFSKGRVGWVMEKRRHVLAPLGRIPRAISPHFCANIHRGPSLIFQVSSRSVLVWGVITEKPLCHAQSNINLGCSSLQTANWVASQCTTAHSVLIKWVRWDQMRSDEMRWIYERLFADEWWRSTTLDDFTFTAAHVVSVESQRLMSYLRTGDKTGQDRIGWPRILGWKNIV